MLSPHSLLKKLFYLLALAGVFSFSACQQKKTAAELAKKKVDDFRQHQKIEAIKAYNELITKYPDSEHVAEAKAKLKVLGPMPATPTPAKRK